MIRKGISPHLAPRNTKEVVKMQWRRPDLIKGADYIRIQSLAPSESTLWQKKAAQIFPVRARTPLGPKTTLSRSLRGH